MLELTQICLKDTQLELHQHQQHEPGEFPSAIFWLLLDGQGVQLSKGSTISRFQVISLKLYSNLKVCISYTFKQYIVICSALPQRRINDFTRIWKIWKWNRNSTSGKTSIWQSHPLYLQWTFFGFLSPMTYPNFSFSNRIHLWNKTYVKLALVARTLSVCIWPLCAMFCFEQVSCSFVCLITKI